MTYTRRYVEAKYANATYLSPFISNVVLSSLSPDTEYRYAVGNGSMWSREISFRTLPLHVTGAKSKVYPIRIGIIGDIGQVHE